MESVNKNTKDYFLEIIQMIWSSSLILSSNATIAMWQLNKGLKYLNLLAQAKNSQLGTLTNSMFRAVQYHLA